VSTPDQVRGRLFRDHALGARGAPDCRSPSSPVFAELSSSSTSAARAVGTGGATASYSLLRCWPMTSSHGVRSCDMSQLLADTGLLHRDAHGPAPTEQATDYCSDLGLTNATTFNPIAAANAIDARASHMLPALQHHTALPTRGVHCPFRTAGSTREPRRCSRRGFRSVAASSRHRDRETQVADVRGALYLVRAFEGQDVRGQRENGLV
jgi:hypothetical protein